MSSSSNSDRPYFGRAIELVREAGASETLRIDDIDCVMVREWSGQWLFDVVLKSGEMVTVAATDQNLECLLEGLGFLIAPSHIESSSCADGSMPEVSQ